MDRKAGHERPCLYRNSFYTGVVGELEKLISEMVESEKSVPCPLDDVSAAIIPHAGLTYSNRGISHAYAQRKRPVSFALIVSPSHYHMLPPDTIAKDSYDAYQTPLGTLPHTPLDLDSPVIIDNSVCGDEHAVEIPLLHLAYQQKIQKSPLHVEVLLVSSFRSKEMIEQVSSAVLLALEKRGIPLDTCLFLASSDLTHWGNRFSHTPYQGMERDEILSHVRDDDMIFMKSVLEGSAPASRPPSSTVCGYAAIQLVSTLARKSGLTGVFHDYYTSEEIGGGGDSFVSYPSVLYGRKT